MKTGELIGLPLDYAVAVARGGTDLDHDTVATWWITLGGKKRALCDGWAQSFSPSTRWEHGGPIIEQERIQVFPHNGSEVWCGVSHVPRDGYTGLITKEGPTPLIAAMRAFVASKLGDEVEIPRRLQ